MKFTFVPQATKDWLVQFFDGMTAAEKLTERSWLTTQRMLIDQELAQKEADFELKFTDLEEQIAQLRQANAENLTTATGDFNLTVSMLGVQDLAELQDMLQGNATEAYQTAEAWEAEKARLEGLAYKAGLKAVSAYDLAERYSASSNNVLPEGATPKLELPEMPIVVDASV